MPLLAGQQKLHGSPLDAAVPHQIDQVDQDRQTFLAVETAIRADNDRLRTERNWWSDRADQLEVELEALREGLRSR